MLAIAFLIGAVVFWYFNILIEELPYEDDSEPILKRIFKIKSRYTDRKKRHILISILGGILALVVFGYYGFSKEAMTVYAVFCILSLISFIDADTQYILPELNIALLLLGIVSIWTMDGPTIIERIVGIFCISVPMLIIIWIVPGGFGLGDIKLMACAGFLLGWKACVVAAFIGIILGGIYGMYVLATKKLGRKDHFAFGPFLSVGIGISMYAQIGLLIADSYISMFRIIKY